MQIVIPMSGFGERFLRAGYRLPKSLIPVEGKPIVAHVLDLFPGAEEVLFICNREHIENPGFQMREVLEFYCPRGRILGIAPHKLGPVHALSQAWEAIDPNRPVVVNYCDFTCCWDWDDFQRFVEETACDGCIPCYRGFHPHMLGSTGYAYVRERGGWAVAIQEKQPFTRTPTAEWASSGTYYFASGMLLRQYAEKAMRRGLTTGGEYYVSLVYRPMMEAGLRVAVYGLQHFMQWGTPEDFAEYRYWSDTFREVIKPASTRARHAGAWLIPAAGLGARFADAGYLNVKPMIEVSGRPMVLQAQSDMPETERQRFVLRRDQPGLGPLVARLREAHPRAEIRVLEGPTDGQARTCLLGLDGLDPDAPLTLGACDCGALYDPAALQRLLDDPEIDVIVWVARGYPGALRRPETYGWVELAGDRITRVSVKKPLASPERDPVILGTFTFKRARDFETAARRMIHRNARVNGEFYVDTCINDALALGLRCAVFEVDRYLCWGTPDDLRTFEYWQSCFHKWVSHPYRLEKDPRVPPARRNELEIRYALTRPARPSGAQDMP